MNTKRFTYNDLALKMPREALQKSHIQKTAFYTQTITETDTYHKNFTSKFSVYYSPYGTLLDGRHGNETSYRYGFNGMEKDDEIKDISGSSYDFGARMYDPRIGRWLAVDKMRHLSEGLTPYRFAFNSPLLFVDPDGNYEVIYTVFKDENGKVVGVTRSYIYSKWKVGSKSSHLYRWTEGGNPYWQISREMAEYYNYTTVKVMQRKSDGSLVQVSNTETIMEEDGYFRTDETWNGYPTYIQEYDGVERDWGISFEGDESYDGIEKDWSRNVTTFSKDLQALAEGYISRLKRNGKKIDIDWGKIKKRDPKEIYELLNTISDTYDEFNMYQIVIKKGFSGDKIEDISKSQLSSLANQKFKYNNSKNVFNWGGDSYVGENVFQTYPIGNSENGGLFLSSDGSFIYNYKKVIFAPDGYKISKTEEGKRWSVEKKE